MPALVVTGLPGSEKHISVDNLAADWLPQLGGGPAPAVVRSHHQAKSILVTGAGGWIGSSLAKAIGQAAPHRLVLLDHSEHDLSQIYRELVEENPSNKSALVPVPGDICDERLLHALFHRYRPAIVYHLAAMKHVPLAESNPFAAIRNNAIGTYRLVLAAHEYGADELVLVSTDKAATPRSVMGVSKRVAELTLLSLNSEKTLLKAVRFGNVFGSRGSAIPLFLRQISQGRPVTITHPEVRRYFFSLQQAIGLVLSTACIAHFGGIFIPASGRQVSIRELAECLIRKAGHIPGTEIPIRYTGLQPGEKLNEDLTSCCEIAGDSIEGVLRSVNSPRMSVMALHRAIAHLEHSVEQFDLTSMLSSLGEMVPEYEPSETLLASAGIQWRNPEVI
ncbi:MAG: polysaccharide biosynthesis protein [Acidobacteriia bacterium]|nr:polysaccharide biosynthesis protein [Terriglobia bacterium]